MTRTSKDIFIKGITIDIAKTAVLKWASENKVKVLINTPDYVYGQWGRGILTGSKHFEITLLPTDTGVIAKTQGWVLGVTGLPMAAPIYLPETDFNSSFLSYGGIPRKEGMKAIERLWCTLEALSET
jgi:hypothetical protein